jgi:preprotein translocase subunit SecB
MAEQEANQKQIAIQKLYLKDISFESPNSPAVFSGDDWQPKTNLNLRSAHKAVTDDVHEVVLTITVEAKQDDTTLFLVEVQQAGLFQIGGYSEEEFDAIVGSFCPTTLFPYARESIATTVAKGGFPEFLLQPINFDALYAESKRQAAAQASEAPAAGENQPN